MVYVGSFNAKDENPAMNGVRASAFLAMSAVVLFLLWFGIRAYYVPPVKMSEQWGMVLLAGIATSIASGICSLGTLPAYESGWLCWRY